MAVDLGDFVDSLKREVDAPGANNFPDATDDEWTGTLADAFWEARLDGFLSPYVCDEDGLVTPSSPNTPDLPRDLVQLVILYASFRVLRNTLRNLRTMFKASAPGPVTFEYQQSANLLTELMKDLSERRKILLVRLSDIGMVKDHYIDSVIARDMAYRNIDTWWVGA